MTATQFRAWPHRLAVVAAVAAAVTLLSACAAGASSGTPTEKPARRILGTWGNPAPQNPYLTFSADHTVKGSDGCNVLSSSYTMHGDTATISRMITTLMACPGVDPWLSKVRTVTVDGDQLVVRDSAGSKIGTLKRTG